MIMRLLVLSSLSKRFAIILPYSRVAYLLLPLFFLTLLRLPRPTLFPYTTLFRSLVEPLAQGFVWGTPVSMAVVDLDGTGSPQVIVTTSERLLYRFVWQKQGLTLAGAPVYDNRLPLESMHALRWAGETRVSIAARHAGGLGLWRYSQSGQEVVAAGAANPVWVLPLPSGRRLMVGEPAQPVSTWVRMPADYLALRVNGNVWTLQDTPLFQGD